jgi:hypothetical protein
MKRKYADHRARPKNNVGWLSWSWDVMAFEKYHQQLVNERKYGTDHSKTQK